MLLSFPVHYWIFATMTRAFGILTTRTLELLSFLCTNDFSCMFLIDLWPESTRVEIQAVSRLFLASLGHRPFFVHDWHDPLFAPTNQQCQGPRRTPLESPGGGGVQWPKAPWRAPGGGGVTAPYFQHFPVWTIFLVRISKGNRQVSMVFPFLVG